VRFIPAREVQELAENHPEEAGRLTPNWLEGPHFADRLDLGLVTITPGGAAGPHIHIGGQVIIAISGRGFVETDGKRVELAPGDVVSCPPGELHAHGAAVDSHFSHLTVTTGGYRFPEPDIVAEAEASD
jgi:quercetin dioxygenase-like cupin family protein